jgi:hypothetical protein
MLYVNNDIKYNQDSVLFLYVMNVCRHFKMTHEINAILKIYSVIGIHCISIMICIARKMNLHFPAYKLLKRILLSFPYSFLLKL